METEYKVRLEIFEGPLDLLLYLIKRDELDIYDISLERITQQYLEYLQAFKELNIDVAGEFVVMAANLIYLKEPQSPPRRSTAARGGRGRGRSAVGFDRQLIEYKKFKEAASHLQARELEQERIFARIGDGVVPEIVPLHLGEVGIFQLINAFQNVIKRLEAKDDLREIFGENFTVSDKIERILQMLAGDTSVRIFGAVRRMASGLKSSSRFSPCSS
jgi:segregation and condensation protein A